MVKRFAFPTIAFFILLFTASQEAAGQYTPAAAIQLAPPQWKADSLFFMESARLSLALDLPEVELRYAIDGNPVDQGSAAALRFLEIPILPGEYEELWVRIIGLPGIPGWHMGSGAVPWLFLDEVVVR